MITSAPPTQIAIHNFSQDGSYRAELKHLFSAEHMDCIEFSQQIIESKNLLVVLEDLSLEDSTHQFLADCVSREFNLFIVDVGDMPLPFFKVSELLSLGALDIIHWKDKKQISKLIQNKLRRRAYIKRKLVSEKIQTKIKGSCPVWQKIMWQAIEVACFSKAPVLILGESGTGKELIAQLIHDLDNRPDKQDFVLLDCSSIVPELSGSEFFGHEKGAFTNAIAMREGAFALANGGSLFLDEVGELPVHLQPALLRVIQEGTYKRVGSNVWRRTDFRLVAATNRSLEKEVDKGNFRQDLYYRLCTCILRLPSLDERRLDIPELATHFLKNELGTDDLPIFDKNITRYLLNRHYPGNVRELQQLIRRIAYKYTGIGPVTMGCLSEVDRANFQFTEYNWKENGFTDAIRQAIADQVGLKEIKRVAGEVAMDIAIEESADNLQEAARLLEVSDRTLQAHQAAKRNGAVLT